MKIDTAEPGAWDWLLEQLSAAGRIAELIQRNSFRELFYFADRPVDAGGFESGRCMNSRGCDEELERFEREQRWLLAIFQNSWSKVGDLDDADANAVGAFTYQGQYYHFSEKPGSLSIATYRRVSVTPFGAILLVARSAEFQSMLAAKAEARVLSEIDADVIRRAARFVFVPVFDGESWLGARLAG